MEALVAEPRGQRSRGGKLGLRADGATPASRRSAAIVAAQVSPKPSSTHASQQLNPYRPSASSNPFHMSTAGWLAHP